MGTYSYVATTRDGLITEGTIDAPDEDGAILKLKTMGVIPLKVKAPRQGPKRLPRLRSLKGELLTFTTELSALLGAGLPLDRGLNILSEISEGKEMKDIIREVLKQIREGNSFSEALSKHPKAFSRLYVSMIRAGEVGGVLDVVLEKLGEFLETADELRSSILSAMVYPIILSIAGGISIIILLVFVIPKFSIIFKEIGGALPFLTQLILTVSNWTRSYWWVGLPVLLAGVFASWSYIKTEKGARSWDQLKLKLMQDVVRKLETARFCRTMGTLIKSGVPFLQALHNAKDVIGNRIIADSIDSVIRNVREGKGVAGPLHNAGVFPPLALSMIKVGEETGQLDVMLIKVASTYERSLKQSVKRLISLLEPAIILAMGLIIAVIVISMLVAIFSILELPF